MMPSPPPLPAPLPVVTLSPLRGPLLFCWLFRFLLPQPLPLIVLLPGALASAIPYTSTFCQTPLARLVFTLPGTMTPPFYCDSVRFSLSMHPPCSVGVLHCPASAYPTDGCHVASHHCLLCVYASHL